MSDYWVSRKKYFCKYCDIYIADDAPSRQHHENGMRHKGNVERFVRGIYKAGEKRKRDGEEEAREIARVDRVESVLTIKVLETLTCRLWLQAAQLAYSADLASGNGAGSSGSKLPPPPVAAAPIAPRKPIAKPSNPYANYSSAASLGIIDPDVARAKAEAEMRRKEGAVGAWSYVPIEPSNTIANDEEMLEHGIKPDRDNEADTKNDESVAPGASSTTNDDEPDARSFKFRKRVVATGLGEIYDPGIITVTPRTLTTLDQKKEVTSPDPPVPDEIKSISTPSDKKWTKIEWKRTVQPVKTNEAPSSADDSAFRRDFVPLPPSAVPAPVVADAPQVKLEDHDESATPALLVEPLPTPNLFKKRRAPTGALAGARARGGRTFETVT